MSETHPGDQFCGDKNCPTCGLRAKVEIRYPVGELHPADQFCFVDMKCPQCYPERRARDRREAFGDRRKTALPLSSKDRKDVPIFSGVVRYFPAALAAVAKISKAGNDKHNPGEEMHHARSKSFDHADCIVRHLIDLDERGGYDENDIPQIAYIAWRALALAQVWLEEHEGAPLAPGAVE